MMNNLSERDRRTLRFGGMAAGAIVVFMVLISPLMDQWTHVNDGIAKDEATLKRIASDLGDAADAKTRLKDLQQVARLNADAVSVSQQTAQMLHQVESLPGYKGLSIARIEGMPLREEDRFYRSAVSLQFSGTLGRLHQFLQDVEKQKPVLKVERISLAANGKDPSRLDGQMVISAYAVVLQKRTNG
jgi:Tfp pilus assembly protein PilO